MMNRNKLRVFIVDDDPFFSSILKNIIEKNFSSLVFSFEKIPDCIRMLFYKPDLIFLDYNFHGKNSSNVNGLTGLSWINEITPETPIIMVSNINFSDKLLKGKQLGATDFILKNNELTGNVVEIVNKKFPQFQEKNNAA